MTRQQQIPELSKHIGPPGRENVERGEIEWFTYRETP